MEDDSGNARSASEAVTRCVQFFYSGMMETKSTQPMRDRVRENPAKIRQNNGRNQQYPEI